MRMGMAGVVMIDGNPIELGSEVFFHPLHETPHEGLQIVVFRAVLGGDDEAELVAVAVGAFDEILAVGAVDGAVVKLSRLAIARNAIALDISKMQFGRFQALAFELYDPGFDDDPALPKGGIAVACGQHPANTGAPADPVAVKAARPR